MSICTYCIQPLATLACGQCAAPYCDTDCQLADWNNHSLLCGDKYGKVMREFKRHELHSGSKNGPIVTNPKQAQAIAISEAKKKKKKK